MRMMIETITPLFLAGVDPRGALGDSLRPAQREEPRGLYRVLNDAQFRLESKIPEALLRIEKGERIAGAPWVWVKTLLSIYATNAYLRGGERDGGSTSILKFAALR